MPRPHAAVALLVIASTASAGLIADYEPMRHDRFLGPIMDAGNVANPDALLAGYDLSGVGVGSRGGVLISDRHVLAAAHFSSNTTRFDFVNAAGVRVGISGQTKRELLQPVELDNGETELRASDVAIITLSRPITAADGLTPLPIGLCEDDIFADLPIFVGDQQNRFGRNIVDGGLVPGTDVTLPPFGVISYSDGRRPTSTIIYDYDTPSNGGTDGTGGDEIGLIGGDSGHAALTLAPGGELVVVGTHFAIAAGDGGPGDDVNYLNFTSIAGDYRPQIDDIFAADGAVGAAFVLVPEPAAALVAVPAALALLRRRPRRT